MIDKEIRESNDITGTYFEEGYNKDFGNIMKFYKEKEGECEFINDIITAKREIRIDISDKPKTSLFITKLEVLESIRNTGPFEVGSRIDELLTDYAQDEDEKITALRTAMSVPFYEVERYALYISDNKRFATHQGVKGLEFPRVMVILDDAQAKGFLFSYEKLFGAKAKSDTDVKNECDGKDTSITRTVRLFYIACTSAKNSLAIVAYTENKELIKDTALSNGWFLEDEI